MRSRYLLILAVMAAGTAQAGLVHSYDFTSGVTDLAGTEDGFLVGGATVGGGVLSLDGTGYAQFGTHIIPTGGSYSVVLDFRSTYPFGLIELISQGSTGAGFYIGRSNGGQIRASDFWPSTGVGYPGDSLWHQVALVVDAVGDSSTLYLDGSAQAVLGSAIVTTTAGTNTRLGSQFAPYEELLIGQIDNVRIYDSAVSGEELAGTPEPSAFLLLASAAGSLALARRRKV